MECYSALKGKDIPTFDTTWMNLEDTPSHKEQTLGDPTHSRPRIDAGDKVEGWLPGPGFHGYRASVWSEEEVLEMMVLMAA